MRMIRSIAVLGLCSTFLLGASKCGGGGDTPPVDNRPTYPAWYSDFSSFSGVNLQHLGMSWGLKPEFVSHPQFLKNLAGMGWNTYRLPISWNAFVDAQGALDVAKISDAQNLMRALVSRLKEVRDQSGQKRIFLILDFHQYKFGGDCGGDGVPKGKINPSGLNPADGNCLFLAYEKFWQNDQGVQDGWIQFAKNFVATAASLAKDNADWLTFGIEPINEPFAGVNSPLFVDNQIQTLLNFTFYFSSGQSAQIQSRLLPFYKKFVEGMKSVPGFSDLITRSLFVMDPFLLDHLNLKISFSGQSFTLASDGDYSSFTELKKVPGTEDAMFWVAGPHHYDGSWDEGFRSFLPSMIGDMVSNYPNVVYNTDQLNARMKLQRDRFIAAGMDQFYGEWGTYTALGNYKGWIADSLAGMKQYSRGFSWWRYEPDSSDQQNAYYLLQKGSDQKFKCGPSFDIVEAIYGKCVQ